MAVLIARVAGLLLTLLLLPPPCGSAGGLRVQPQARAVQSAEDHVKAAFLLNFARFIEWPATAFENARSPIRLCLLNDDARLMPLLGALVEGERAHGRPILAGVSDTPEEIRGCHLAFVSGRHVDRLPAVLNAIADRPTVLVGESPQFLERGGALNLFIEGGRVRFELDPAEMMRRGVRVSSHMLRLARLRSDSTAGPS